MTFLTRKALPRRTFLRGMGATLALPMLDAMAPALAEKTSSQLIMRVGNVAVLYRRLPAGESAPA